MNERLANIKVVKKDIVNEKVLPNAKFTITCNGQYLQSDGSLGTEEHEFITDANGIISLGKVHAGTYTLHETEAPEGYIVANDVMFTIDDGVVYVNNEAVNEITVHDVPVYDLPNSGIMPWTLFMIFADIAVITGVAYYIRSTRRKTQQKTDMPKS